MRDFFVETNKYIKSNLKSLILFEILYKSLFIIAVVPMFSWSLQKLLKFLGYSYLTLANIGNFLRSPFTIIYCFVFLSLVALFIMVEHISLIIYCFSSVQERKIGVTQIIFPSIHRTWKLLRNRKNIVLPLFCLMDALVLGIPLIYNFIVSTRVPSYIVKSIMHVKSVVFLLVFLIFLAIYVAFRGIFVIHFCVLENMDLRQAYRESKKLERGHIRQIVKNLFFFNLILLMAYLIFYIIVIFITGEIVYKTLDKSVVVVVFIRFVSHINGYAMLFFSVLTSIANFGMITKMFVTYKKEHELLGRDIKKLQNKIVQSMDEESNEIRIFKRKPLLARGRYIRLLSICTVIVIFFNVYYLVTGFYKGAFVETGSMFGTYVTAHRGASKMAPENTLESIQAAIDTVSDYAEIDVQETKDGIVVLLHDSNLKRTCGVNKNIWDVTYEELLTYDAGAKFSNEFIGTKVPTLAEVLELCQGKIKLNIEIKVTSHQQNLVEKVVALIEEYNFVRQCVVSSTNYSALARVKELNDSIKTGYILSVAYGYFFDNEYADFFSVKSSFINETLVRTAHSLGKEVHAWTLNSRSEIERMKLLGVDNMITDDPLMVREIIYDDTNVATFKDLLESLFKVN